MQPKSVKVDDNPRVCPRCGTSTASLRRLDNYLSLFFLPVARLKKGDTTFLECSRCGGRFDPQQAARDLYSRPSVNESSRRCPGCGHPLETGWRFCPDCGRQV